MHNDVRDMSASLSGQQMLGRLGQMLAVLCGRVKYSGEGYQKCPHKNTKGDHRERDDGRNDLACSGERGMCGRFL